MDAVRPVSGMCLEQYPISPFFVSITSLISVTTIPDNTVQNLTFVDPTSGQTQSCSNPCPLLTDSSVLYQDFMFDGALNITGFQLQLSEWTGAGPGLHILQLLSSGAFAYAVQSDNSVSCFAPNPSNTTRTGTWTEKDVDTSIAATTQQILVSDVAVGTSASEGPSFTWMPYVSASGNYNVSLLVPGCTNFQDCPLRTSVKVTVFPSAGQSPTVTTVSQQNTEDVAVPIYNGPVEPSSDDFAMTVIMTLADQPAGTGQNGQYEIVADRVQLVLSSAANFGNGSTGSTNVTGSAESGFGFFEWPLSSTSSVSATSALPNSSITSLDSIAFDLLQAVGGSAGLSSVNSPFVSAVAHHSSGTVFLAGNFNLTSGSASGASNIVAFSGGVLTSLTNNGLNGQVSSLALDGDKLYVAGAFVDTASGSTSGQLAGVAMYDVQQKQWSALQAGVDGAVSSLVLTDNSTLLVTGNFTSVRAGNNGRGAQNAGGFAAWDIQSESWTNSGGFLAGSMTFVSNGTSSNNDNQYVAGNVVASLKFGASGFVMLQNGPDGAPEVTPLGVQLDDDSVISSGGSLSRRRLHMHARKFAASLIPRVNVLNLFKRQTSSSLAPLPPTPPAPAPAVLTGTFWTNSSSSEEVVIIGGNFSFTASGSSAISQNIAIYDPNNKNVKALQGTQVNGTVRNLLVQGDQLLVAGQFTLSGTNVNGLAIYDLAQQQWDVSDLQPLQATSGSSVVVRSVSASPSQKNTVIVAGSFAQAGSQPCRAVCALNIATKQWNALGNGIQGDVASVDYAGVWNFILMYLSSQGLLKYLTG